MTAGRWKYSVLKGGDNMWDKILAGALIIVRAIIEKVEKKD